MTIQQTNLQAYNTVKSRTGPNHRQICEALARYGDMTDEEIAWKTGLFLRTINPRRGELVKMGLVRQKAIKKNARGKSAIVWGL